MKLRLFVAVLLFLASFDVWAGAQPKAHRVLIDVRSTHSDGAHDVDSLIRMARRRHIDVLALTEHDRFSIRLGLDPLQHILGYARQHPSLYTTGVEAFFDDLARARRVHPEMTILAGTESIPGYYWSGIPFRDLTLHQAERHLITLGAERPEQIRALPSYDLRYAYGNRTLSLAVWSVAALVLLLVLLRRRKRSVALLLAASYVAFLTTWMTREKVDADAEFIRAARDQGLMTIWAHPGTLSGVRSGPLGIRFDTPPYSKRVFAGVTADAFAAVYGDTDHNTEPGGLWDRFMMDHAMGYRKRPIWAVAAGDFHREGEAGEHLGNFPMDVWAESAGEKDILAALRSGRSAAWGLPADRDLSLADYHLEDAQGRWLLPGGSRQDAPARLTLVVRLRDLGSAPADAPETLQAQWIEDGQVIGTVPLTVNGKTLRLPLTLDPGVHVLRLRIPAQHHIRMVANPFLLRVHD